MWMRGGDIREEDTRLALFRRTGTRPNQCGFMRTASIAPSLARTQTAIDRLLLPAAILPCSGTRSATFAHPAPTRASSRLTVLFRAKTSSGGGQLPDQA